MLLLDSLCIRASGCYCRKCHDFKIMCWNAYCGNTTIGLYSTQVTGDISALQNLTALTYISFSSACVLYK